MKTDCSNCEIDEEDETKYPDTYLHVREGRSGQEWIVEIRPRQTLDLARRVREWIKSEFCGEARLDGEIMPRVEGDYYAAIYTDGRAPGAVCWDGGGFYITLDA